MVNHLRQRGYRTTIEHARHYIDLQQLGGRSVADIRSRQLDFQRGVLAMQLRQEAALDPDDVVFLDRALPDSLAYYRFLDLSPDPSLLDALKRVAYRRVFLLDLLPLTKDYARTEDAEAQHRIHALLFETYGALHLAIEGPGAPAGGARPVRPRPPLSEALRPMTRRVEWPDDQQARGVESRWGRAVRRPKR
jgi:predicted ATPase